MVDENGNITFNAEEQKVIDKTIGDRVKLTKEELEDLKIQLEKAKEKPTEWQEKVSAFESKVKEQESEIAKLSSTAKKLNIANEYGLTKDYTTILLDLSTDDEEVIKSSAALLSKAVARPMINGKKPETNTEQEKAATLGKFVRGQDD
jgi:hypothetical protein